MLVLVSFKYPIELIGNITEGAVYLRIKMFGLCPAVTFYDNVKGLFMAEGSLVRPL
jgi:hypothetical protein